MATLSFRNVRKTYPGGVAVIHGIDMEVQDGEFVVIVGPSGCGKSTLMRMVAGLESITAGGMRNFYHEVEGAKAVQFMATDGLASTPIVLTGLAVSEMDVPSDVRYEAFIEVPQKLDALLRTIDKLVGARRKGAQIAPE